MTLKKMFLAASLVLATASASHALSISISWSADPGGFKCWVPASGCTRTVTITFKTQAIDDAFEEAGIVVPDGYEKGVITSGVDENEFDVFEEITVPGYGTYIPQQEAVWSGSLNGYLVYFKK